MKKIIGVLLLLVMLLSIMPAAFAGSDSNQWTTNGKLSASTVMAGDSYVTGDGRPMKVTLYLGTTNDTRYMPTKADGTVDPSKADLGKMIKFGKSFIVSGSGTDERGRALFGYANLSTCKIDALVDLRSGTKIAPSYKDSSGKLVEVSESNGRLVVISGLPAWEAGDKPNSVPIKSWYSDAQNGNSFKTLTD